MGLVSSELKSTPSLFKCALRADDAASKSKAYLKEFSEERERDTHRERGRQRERERESGRERAREGSSGRRGDYFQIQNTAHVGGTYISSRRRMRPVVDHGLPRVFWIIELMWIPRYVSSWGNTTTLIQNLGGVYTKWELVHTTCDMRIRRSHKTSQVYHHISLV